MAAGGEGTLVDNAEIYSGKLKPGAALQIWHTTDIEKVGETRGHSQVFVSYTYDDKQQIDGMMVFDNSGALEERTRSYDEKNEYIRTGNLIDPSK